MILAKLHSTLIYPRIYMFAVIVCFSAVSCKSNSANKVFSPPDNIDDGWVVSTLSEQGINDSLITEMHTKIYNDDYENVHSVLIVKNGYLVFEEYYNGYDQDDKHRLFSISKSVSSGLIGMAIEKNHINSVMDTIPQYFPEYTQIDWSGGKGQIKIDDLLTMRAGLEWEELLYPYPDARNSHRQMTVSNDWIRFVLQRPMEHEPGTHFEYNTGVSNLFARIIENTSGKSIGLFAEEFLFNKLGIEKYNWYRDPQGNPCSGGSGGGLQLRPRDLIKFGYLYMRNGYWNGESIIDSGWVSESIRPHVKFSATGGYGYQWWMMAFEINDTVIETVYGLGYGGQYMFLIEELDMLVLYMSGNYENDFAYSQPLEILDVYILPAAMP